MHKHSIPPTVVDVPAVTNTDLVCAWVCLQPGSCPYSLMQLAGNLIMALLVLPGCCIRALYLKAL